MSRTKGATGAPVRFEEGTWEYRCEDCKRGGRGSCWWPLTSDFWDTVKGMTRCRACWSDRRNARNRARWASDPTWAEAKRAENREQRRAKRAFAYRERYARLKADPVRYAAYRESRRAPQREATARWRARLSFLPESGNADAMGTATTATEAA